MSDIKLTKKQREVVDRLRNGGMLITNETSAWISNPKHTQYQDEQLHLKVFFNLVKKGIIFQDYDDHFNYNLTDLGKSIEL